MGISVGVLGVAYSRILGQNLDFFVPYLAIGLVVWGFISSVMQEAPLVYPNSRHIILSMPVRVENIVLRMVVRNFIVMLHNSIILVPIYIFFGAELRWEMFFSLLGMLSLLVFSCSMAVTLGLAGARFRDVAPTVSALMGMLFLLTPIIWQPAQFQFIADVNPLYHLIEAVRSPLVGASVSYKSVAISVVLAGSSVVVALFSLHRYRYRLVFWI